MDEFSTETLPRSGVDGLTPRQVRDALSANGWASIPIGDHDAASKAAGKAPTLKNWQRFAVFDGPMPSAIERAGWERSVWQGPGTGVPCGDVIGIDIDVSDPALAADITSIAFKIFGATPFVRQGRAPRVMLVYRGAAPLPKQALKANDGSGDGLDIMGEGSQFVAFGIHAKTCRLYEWTGAETPLTAGSHAAPVISIEHIETFIDRVRAVLPLSKTGGRSHGKGGPSAEIVRDADGFVIDGREIWMTRKVWGAVTALHLAGTILTEALVTELVWAEFERTARVEVDGRRWTEADCLTKVRGTLDRVRRNAMKLPIVPASVVATYADESMPLAEAEATVARHIGDFFKRAGQFQNRAILHKIGPLGARGLPPLPFGVALRVEAGVGKTEAAVRAVVATPGLSVVYSVPTVELADAIAERLNNLGGDARVWRGRDRDDPDAPGLRMCRDLQAVADARRANAYSVAGAVCAAKARNGETKRCQFFETCGHVRQRSAAPAVWVTTHGMLFSQRAAAIQAPDALIIDESFSGKAIPDRPRDLAVDDIMRSGLPPDFADARSLQRKRRAVDEALRVSEIGPLTREALVAAGVTAEIAREAHAGEWRRYINPDIVPGQAPTDRESRVVAVASNNAEVKALAGLWSEIADFLDSDIPASGRLEIFADRAGARIIRRRSLRIVHDTWRAPALILDATAPPASILSIALGMPVALRASIRAAWHPAGHVRQVVGAPVSSKQLGGRGQAGGDRFLDELARYVALRAAGVHPSKVGVVIQKGLVERFEACPLPDNLEVRHFGALAGLDHWRDYVGMIIIGRTAPPPGAMEADAGVLSGEPVTTTSEPFTTGGILRRDGSVVAVPALRLSDPLAEALRHQVCEGNAIQAIGRIRPLRLHGRERFFVDVIADVPLPIVADEVVKWDDAKPAAWAAMADQGVVLTSPSDILAARSDLAATRDEARNLAEGVTMGVTSRHNVFFLDVGPIVSPFRRVRYKRRGRQFRATEAFLLANAPRDRRALRLGPFRALGAMDYFEVEGEPPMPTWIEVVARCLPRPLHATALGRVMADVKARERRWVKIVGAAMRAGSGEA